MSTEPSVKTTWLKSFESAALALEALRTNDKLLSKCELFSSKIIECFESNGTIFCAGNGGSHCDAMHFSEELTGRYKKNRKPLGALALGDASHITCVSNDYGFEYIFSRQLEALARPKDLFIGLSTSGNSKNILQAFQTAKKLGIYSMALLGKDGGQAASMADHSIVVPAQTSERIQELHIKIIHTSIEVIERKLFPENYS